MTGPRDPGVFCPNSCQRQEIITHSYLALGTQMLYWVKTSSLMKTHKNIFVFKSFSPLSPIQWVEGPTLKMSYGLPWCGTLRPKPLRTGEWRLTCCPRKQDTLSSGAASFGKSAGSTWGREITCNTSIISKYDQINTSEKIKYAFATGYNFSTGEAWFKTLCAVLSHRKGFFCI